MNKMLIYLKPDFSHFDDRGSLVQLASKGWNQINVIKSEKGAIRGNHYHKNNIEAFYIVEGGFKLILEKDNKKETYDIKKGDFFMVEPYVNHTFEYLEDTTLISMYDKGVEEGNGKMDIYTPEK